jgi:hypothetical protein
MVMSVVVITVVMLMKNVHQNQVKDQTKDCSNEHDLSIDFILLENSSKGFVDECDGTGDKEK